MKTKITLLFAAAVFSINFAFAQCAANFSYSVNPANNGSVQFTTTSPVLSNMSYFWNFNDGSSSSLMNPLHTFSNGTHNVCLYAFDSTNNISCNYCSTITVLNNSSSSCTAMFSAFDSLGTVYLQDLSSGTNISYMWNFGDNMVSYSSGNVSHQYAQSGAYNVCLTIYNNNGCQNNYCSLVNIIVPSTCNAGFTYNVTSNNGGNVSFNNTTTSSTNSMLYYWNFGDGNGSDQFNPNHVFQTGSWNVCLTVTDTLNNTTCSYCDTVTVSNDTLTPCNAMFSYIDSALYVYFQNFSVGNNLNYQWNFGDGDSSQTAGDVIHQYAQNGTYTACLNIYNTITGCSDNYCSTITVGDQSACNANFVIYQDSTNLYSYFVYSYATQSTPNNTVSYQWSFGDGTGSQSAYPSHIYTGSGPYLLCLTVATANNCTTSFCDTIVPGHAQSQSTSLQVLNPATVGINEHSFNAEALNSSPNPFSVSSTISFVLKETNSIELLITDILGNKISTVEKGLKTAGNYSVNLDASLLANGIYFLQLKTNEKIITKKLIVSK